MSRGYKRLAFVVTTALVLLLTMSALAYAADPVAPFDDPDPPATAGRNSDCLACHESSSRMATSTVTTAFSWQMAPVNKGTACRKCHTMSLLGTHPYHNVGMPCSGCHNGWEGTALFSAVPSYRDAAIGSFAAPSSVNVASDALHQIHAVPRWPAKADKANSRCASCHEVAACNACHEDLPGGINTLHGEHPTGQQPWTGKVGNGIVSSQTEYTVTDASYSCASVGCHSIAGLPTSGPLSFENNLAKNPDVVYTGTWKEVFKSLYTGGRQHISGTTGARADFTFTGGQVQLIGDRDPYRGLVDIYIDPATNPTPVATVNLYSITTVTQKLLFQSGALDPSVPHVLRVQVNGGKDTDARAAFISIDQFKVRSQPTGYFAPTCYSCHAGVEVDKHDPYGPGTGFSHEATNSATATYQLPGYAAYQCNECHQVKYGRQLPNEHERTSSSIVGSSCYECHDNPAGPFIDKAPPLTSNGTCGYTNPNNGRNCHAGGDGTHSFATSNHNVLSDVADPNGAVCRGCHTGDLLVIHDNSITTNDASIVTNCLSCHGPTEYPAGKSCVQAGCHAFNTFSDHPAVPTRHDAAQAQSATTNTGGNACTSCHAHDSLPLQTNLQPEHTEYSVTCTQCHSASYYPRPWDTAGGANDKYCSDCHAAGKASNPVHGDYAGRHLPDASSQAACSTGTGCHGTDMGTTHDQSVLGNTRNPDCLNTCHTSTTGNPALKSSCAAVGCHPAYTHGSDGVDYHKSNGDWSSCNTGCHAKGTTLMGLHNNNCATCHNNPVRDPVNPNLTWDSGVQKTMSSCAGTRCHAGYTATAHGAKNGIDTSHTATAITAASEVYGGAKDTTGTACTSYCHITTMGGGDLGTKGEHDWVRDNNGGLSSGNIVTCVECHTSADYTSGGKAAFASSKNCSACHTNFVGATGTHGGGGHNITESQSVTCWNTGCHTGSQQPLFYPRVTDTSAPNNIAELHSNAATTVASVTYRSCNVCHRSQAAVIGFRTGAAVTSCWDCHDPNHAIVGYDHLATLSAYSDSPTPNTGCTGSGAGCHGTSNNVGMIHTLTNYGAGCSQYAANTCHNKTATDGANDPYDSKLGGGHECVECHNAAMYPETPNANPLATPAPNGHYGVTTHTATAFTTTNLTMSGGTASAACSDCHKAFGANPAGLHGIHQGVPSSSYGPVMTCYECHTNPSNATMPSTAVVKGNWDPVGTADDRKCTACHTVGSNTPATHAAALPAATATSSLNCGSSGTGCHNTTNLHELHKAVSVSGAAGCTITDNANGGGACHNMTVQVAKPTATTCGGASGACHKAYLTPVGNNGNHNLVNATSDPGSQHNALGMTTEVDNAGTYRKTCAACHSGWLRTEHAVLKTAGSYGSGGVVCTECHTSTTTLGGGTPQSRVLDNWGTGAKLCSNCHTLNQSHGSVTGGTVGMHAVAESTSAGALCSTCHVGFNTNAANAHAEATTDTPSALSSCNVCHVDAETMQYSRVKTGGSSAAAWDCYDCHAQAVFSATHSPPHLANLSGTVGGITYAEGNNVGCFNGCHYTDLRLEHGPSTYSNSNGTGGNRTMEGNKGSSTQWCTVCHTAADATFSGATAGAYANNTGVRAAVVNGDYRCSTCHSNTTGEDSVAGGVESGHRDAYNATAGTDGNYIVPTQISAAPSATAVEFQNWTSVTTFSGGGHNSYSTNAYPYSTGWTWNNAMNTGWTGGTAQKVLCSDCHLGTGGTGPQGQSVPYGLINYTASTSLAITRTNTNGTAWPTAGVTNRTQAVAGDWYNGTGPYFIPNGETNSGFQAPGLCGKCHGVMSGPYHGGNGGHDFPYEVSKTGPQLLNSPPCIMCHIKIPHAWKRPRLLRRVVATTNTSVPVAQRVADAPPYADPAERWTVQGGSTQLQGFVGPMSTGIASSAGCVESVCLKHGNTATDLWP